MRKSVLLLFFLSSLLLAQSALNLTLSGYPARLNPILATDSVSSSLTDWIFDGLLRYDKEGEIIGDIAKSWHFEDEKTLIFTLRRDRTWHDGEPVTAHDVVFTYETIVSDRVFTPYASNFRMVDQVEAIDDYTVRVVHTASYFKALETWLGSLIPKHILADDPDLMTSDFNRRPVGNSYFRLEELSLSSNLELLAYRDFQPRPPHIDRVVFSYVQDPSVEFLKLKSRQIHIGNLEAMQVERQLDSGFEKDYRIIEYPAFNYNYLGFNLRLEKFQDERVRQALNYAIDRQELIDILFFGRARVSHGPILEGALGFNEAVRTPDRDLKKARALLAEAGYTADNPLRFEIATNSNNPIRVYAAQIMQHQLAQAGVQVRLRVMEWQAFLNQVVHAREFETVLLAWSVPLMPDPFTIWHSSMDKKGGFNFVGYASDRVDAIIEEAQSTVDRDALDQLFQRYHAEVVNDLPYLFLYSPNAISAVSRQLTPIEPTLMGYGHNRFDWRLHP